jgi:hypothetical protein
MLGLLLVVVVRALANRPVVVLVVPRAVVEVGRVAVEESVVILALEPLLGFVTIDMRALLVVVMRAEGVGTMEWRAVTGLVTPRSIGCERMEEDLSGLLYCCEVVGSR